MGDDDLKLEEALCRVFNMVPEDARVTAETISSAFQGEDEVNDEDLDKDIRSLFYMLEKERLLNVRRTEYKFEGQVRRAYFWRFNHNHDDGAGGRLGAVRSPEDAEALKVYRALPPNLWARRSS